MNKRRDGDRQKSHAMIHIGMEQCAGNIKHVNGKHTCYHRLWHLIKCCSLYDGQVQQGSALQICWHVNYILQVQGGHSREHHNIT